MLNTTELALIDKRKRYPTLMSLARLCVLKPRARDRRHHRVIQMPKRPRDLVAHQARCVARKRTSPAERPPGWQPDWAPLLRNA